MARLGPWPSVLPALLLAVAAGGIAATRGFDGLYGQDAYAYFDYATLSVRESILRLAPLEPFFWPPGYPLLVALLSLVVGSIPLAGQAVSLAMGGLVALLTVLLVRELWPDETPMALLAGAFVGLCGQLWQSSVVVMPDTTGLAPATLSAVALVRYRRRVQLGWLLLASAAVAYATLTRWIYGLVAIPFALYALSGLAKAPRPLLHAAAAIAVAIIVVSPTLSSLVGLSTHPGDPAAFAGNFQVYSWSPLNAVRHDFQTVDGHLAYALPNGVYYGMAPGNLAFFGPLLALLLLPGVWAARRWPPPTLILVGGWAAIVYAFHAGAPWQNFRFTLAYLPPLAIVLAGGAVEVWRYLTGRRQRWTLMAFVGAGLLLQAVGAARLVENFIDRKDQDLALVRWVQAQAPPNAQLFSFGLTLTLRHYSALPTFDLFEVQGQSDIRRILGLPGPHFVVVDEGSLESQWYGQAPWVNFHILSDAPGLTRVGTATGYTLFRVNSG